MTVGSTIVVIDDDARRSDALKAVLEFADIGAAVFLDARQWRENPPAADEVLAVTLSAGQPEALQIAQDAGAQVIGLASSAEKRALVEGLGADATVDSRSEDLHAALLEANDGEKVDAVLHMSGGAAFDAELRALAPLGRMVVFGNASRESSQIDAGVLLHGSKAVIGFWLVHVLARRDLAVPLVGELLEALATGALRVTIGGVYPLSEAARAHEALESRTSAGKLLLDPTS